ncbi:ketopantoate reductase family protein [Cypionkella sp.]|uniref:ketopantoate reductase family protein n=1 Tax=Cypionkella sp. TaxID=2811411 RepID=UPI002626F81F|nr:2-dehydropantoate 2-reductase N-terminal domain-containing protein [Cypionkella sp.]MDB5664852.1 Ketopantoate reductase [Cypionkella sp.]
MTYVIFGAGAVGTSLAAQFTEAGIDTVLVGRGRQLEHLLSHGLLYKRARGPSQIALNLSDINSLRLKPDDILLLAVKGQDVEELSAQIALLPVEGGGVAADLPVVTMQNGLEAERIVARRFSRLYAAVVRVPAIYTEVGKVSVLAEPQFASVSIGRFPQGRDAISARLTADLTQANALAEEHADIRRWKAQKLTYNVRNVVELFAGTPDQVAFVGNALAAEAEVVLKAAGFDPAAEAERKVSLGGWKVTRDPTAPSGQSTWQSFTRGARSEVDFLNGEIVLQARLHGLDAPWNLAAQRLAAELAASGGVPGSIALDRLVSLAQSDARARAAAAH